MTPARRGVDNTKKQDTRGKILHVLDEAWAVAA